VAIPAYIKYVRRAKELTKDQRLVGKDTDTSEWATIVPLRVSVIGHYEWHLPEEVIIERA